MINFKSAQAQFCLKQDGTSLTVDDLQPGDILLHCPKSPKLHQQAISNQTQSPYTHAAIYLGDGIIAEALTVGGVQKNPISSVIEGAAHVGVLRSQMGLDPSRAAQLNEFIDLVINEGRFYNFHGAFNWKHINKTFVDNQMNIIAKRYGEFNTSEDIAKSSFFCSSLVVACFMAVGIIAPTAQVAYPPSAIAPAGLYSDPTFGWLRGFLVPEGNNVADNDPLLTITRWSDIED